MQNNELIKYSYQLAHNISESIHSVDVPSLVVNHPVLYFGFTFGVGLAVAKYMGWLKPLWNWYYLGDINFGTIAPQVYIENCRKIKQTLYGNTPYKMERYTNIPDALSLTTQDNPFRGTPINFEFYTRGLKYARSHPSDFKIIYVDEFQSQHITDTMLLCLKQILRHPQQQVIGSFKEMLQCGDTIIRLIEWDVLVHSRVEDYGFYVDLIEGITYEMHRPFTEISQFMDKYYDCFIERVDNYPIHDSFYLILHKPNFHKFADVYNSLEIFKHQKPMAKQWMISIWDYQSDLQFQRFKLYYNLSFRDFTRHYFDSSLLSPEKIEQLNRHKIAFKHLWVDLSLRIPPEVLMYDVTFVDRMITYQHYLNYAMGYGVII